MEETDNKQTDETKEVDKGAEVKPTDSKGGVQSETISELDRADQIAERQKRENDRREEILTREENLAARKAVGGVTDGGNPEEKPKEETDKEYKDKIMSGNANA